MESELSKLIRTIVEALVDDPSQIQIEEMEGSQSRIVEVTVAKEDVGKVIGKGGKTAEAIRTIVYSIAGKDKKRTSLQILDRRD